MGDGSTVPRFLHVLEIDDPDYYAKLDGCAKEIDKLMLNVNQVKEFLTNPQQNQTWTGDIKIRLREIANHKKFANPSPDLKDAMKKLFESLKSPGALVTECPSPLNSNGYKNAILFDIVLVEMAKFGWSPTNLDYFYSFNTKEERRNILEHVFGTNVQLPNVPEYLKRWQLGTDAREEMEEIEADSELIKRQFSNFDFVCFLRTMYDVFNARQWYATNATNEKYCEYFEYVTRNKYLVLDDLATTALAVRGSRGWSRNFAAVKIIATEHAKSRIDAVNTILEERERLIEEYAKSVLRKRRESAGTDAPTRAALDEFDDKFDDKFDDEFDDEFDDFVVRNSTPSGPAEHAFDHPCLFARLCIADPVRSDPNRSNRANRASVKELLKLASQYKWQDAHDSFLDVWEAFENHSEDKILFVKIDYLGSRSWPFEWNGVLRRLDKLCPVHQPADDDVQNKFSNVGTVWRADWWFGDATDATDSYGAKKRLVPSLPRAFTINQMSASFVDEDAPGTTGKVLSSLVRRRGQRTPFHEGGKRAVASVRTTLDKLQSDPSPSPYFTDYAISQTPSNYIQWPCNELVNLARYPQIEYFREKWPIDLTIRRDQFINRVVFMQRTETRTLKNRVGDLALASQEAVLCAIPNVQLLENEAENPNLLAKLLVSRQTTRTVESLDADLDKPVEGTNSNTSQSGTRTPSLLRRASSISLRCCMRFLQNKLREHQSARKTTTY